MKAFKKLAAMRSNIEEISGVFLLSTGLACTLSTNPTFQSINENILDVSATIEKANHRINAENSLEKKTPNYTRFAFAGY